MCIGLLDRYTTIIDRRINPFNSDEKILRNKLNIFIPNDFNKDRLLGAFLN